MTEKRTPANGWRTSEETCPHCHANLQGAPVPEVHLTHENDCTGTNFQCSRWHRALHDDGKCHAAFRGGECGLPLAETTCMCLPYGKVTHFSRMIGVEISGVYDGVLYWRCPDCGGTWHRWDLPDMRAKAEQYMNPTS